MIEMRVFGRTDSLASHNLFLIHHVLKDVFGTRGTIVIKGGIRLSSSNKREFMQVKMVFETSHSDYFDLPGYAKGMKLLC